MSKLVLLTEDQAIISLGLEDALTEAGFRIAGPFARCAGALDWLKENTPDVALLDVELADGPCTEVARTLRQREVPVVFLTGGMVRDPDIRVQASNALWFEKPASYLTVMQALQDLVEP